MTGDPSGVIEFEHGGALYRMIFDMKAIAFFEREADISIVTALGELEQARERGELPKISVLAFLMQAGLRRHHPEVSAERALRMAGDPAVQAALGAGVAAAMPPADGESAEGNAAAPVKPGKRRGTGTPSSRRRSKQA